MLNPKTQTTKHKAKLTLSFKNCSYVCVYHCVQLSYTTQHRTVFTRNTGTGHTSAKARLTSAVIWLISMCSRFMSVNHFPYLPIVMNPENNPCIQMVIWITTKI